MHPVRYGTERVVVEARHLARIDRSVREHRVPALPDRRGAHGHGVQPAWAASFEQESVRDAHVAGGRERIQYERGAGEPGTDVVAIVGRKLGETVAGLRT